LCACSKWWDRKASHTNTCDGNSCRHIVSAEGHRAWKQKTRSFASSCDVLAYGAGAHQTPSFLTLFLRIVTTRTVPSLAVEDPPSSAGALPALFRKPCEMVCPTQNVEPGYERYRTMMLSSIPPLPSYGCFPMSRRRRVIPARFPRIT
jgi:hypothetical protein